MKPNAANTPIPASTSKLEFANRQPNRYLLNQNLFQVRCIRDHNPETDGKREEDLTVSRNPHARIREF